MNAPRAALLAAIALLAPVAGAGGGVDALLCAATGRSCEEWTTFHGGPSGLSDVATEVAAAAGRVFATGISDEGSEGGSASVTLALDAATGAVLWDDVERGLGDAWGGGITTSPDGGVVYLAAFTASSTSAVRDPYLVVAFRAATGEEVWRASVTHPTADAEPHAIAADAQAVYVTGAAHGAFTVALDPATGAVLWTAHRPADAGGRDLVLADGRLVVAGASGYAVAYASTTGATLWDVAVPTTAPGVILSIAPLDDGAFAVAGRRNAPAPFGETETRFYVAALDATTGDVRWERTVEPHAMRLRDGAFEVESVAGLAIASGYVTDAAGNLPDFYVAALDSASGDLAWDRLTSSVWEDHAWGLAVDGDRIVVSGDAWNTAFADAVTMVIDAATGAVERTWTFDRGGTNEEAWDVVVSDGRAFVAGSSYALAPGAWKDYTLLAYDFD